MQTILRILQQFYITKRFYGHEESLGRQAQAASERARELAKTDGGGGGGPLAQARRELSGAKADAKSGGKSGEKSSGKKPSKGKADAEPAPAIRPSKRTTAPKNRPTPNAKRPSTRQPGRPTSRPASATKRKRK